MNCVNIDVGSVDLYFRDIAGLVASDSAEEDLLEALSKELNSVAQSSGDAAEKAFCCEAAGRCAALAQWFKDNQP